MTSLCVLGDLDDRDRVWLRFVRSVQALGCLVLGVVRVDLPDDGISGAVLIEAGCISLRTNRAVGIALVDVAGEVAFHHEQQLAAELAEAFGACERHPPALRIAG